MSGQTAVGTDFNENLRVIVEHRLVEAINAGRPPANRNAWKASVRKQLIAELGPGQIAQEANGLRARAEGKRLTFCREVRGSHSSMHVFDWQGTDPPPKGWSIDEAKRLAGIS